MFLAILEQCGPPEPSSHQNRAIEGNCPSIHAADFAPYWSRNDTGTYAKARPSARARGGRF
jgi:hypothetical protein